MIIEIKQPVTKEKVLQAIKKTSESAEKKTLRKHFGKLKTDHHDYLAQEPAGSYKRLKK